ncbi:hypothetical protein BEP19_09135 [Ammoniphilus oxalaticus]|uniref:J domain-containing protein n=1 Tax=Ammoniphilus oxalaticus TaxID=66863 RepID=A0A419SKT1_9BACL|nr:J domain-containing protein [Ammoniphilus oxalaticus]RKD24536.1 hypothetical protein BEP19_09135 [Ammoniphilus oxalaticus]
MNELMEERRCPSCQTTNRVKVDQVMDAVCASCGQKLIRHHYDLLQVPTNADPHEMKQAYRKQAMKWHPDKHSDPVQFSAANAYFRAINEAYAVLSKEARRNESASEVKEGRTDSASMDLSQQAARRQFMDEMYTLALELALDSLNTKQIALRLKEQGCDPKVADIVAQASVSYRKRQARKKARKPLALAVFWFLFGSFILYKVGPPFHVVAWLLFMYASYHGLRAMFMIIAGRESVRLK